MPVIRANTKRLLWTSHDRRRRPRLADRCRGAEAARQATREAGSLWHCPLGITSEGRTQAGGVRGDANADCRLAYSLAPSQSARTHGPPGSGLLAGSSVHWPAALAAPNPLDLPVLCYLKSYGWGLFAMGATISPWSAIVLTRARAVPRIPSGDTNQRARGIFNNVFGTRADGAKIGAIHHRVPPVMVRAYRRPL
jgi:hypothetical protein